MIELDGGIMLPTPVKAKGFTMPEGYPRRRWDSERNDRWTRAYMHCLYTLPLHFECCIALHGRNGTSRLCSL